MQESEKKKKYTFSSEKVRSIIRVYFFSKIFLYYTLVFVYLLLGGLFFHLIEGRYEEAQRAAAVEELGKLESNARVFLNSLNISNETVPDGKLKLLSSYLVEVSENISTLTSQSSSVMKWTFGRSMYFSFIVITTIGYGQLAPVTVNGQILLCFYALFGIPIFLLLVTETSKAFTSTFDRVVLRKVKKERYRWIAIALAFGVGIITMIFIPAAIYGAIESWPYSTSAYFCFVSLSTIGFGDYVLGDNPNAEYNFNTNVADLYVISSIIWLYLGLVFLVILIEQVGTGIVKFDDYLGRMIDRCISKRRKKEPILENIEETKSPVNVNASFGQDDSIDPDVTTTVQ